MVAESSQFADLAGCGPVFLAGQRGSAGGAAFPDLGDKGLDGGEGEVRAVAEDGVTRPGKSHEAGGVGRQVRCRGFLPGLPVQAELVFSDAPGVLPVDQVLSVAGIAELAGDLL